MSTYANPLTDYSPQMEFEETSESYFDNRPRGVLTDADEMELAAEFLEIADEEELEQFLGSLVSGIGSALGTFVKSPIGHAIGGVLKDVAKTALPIAGSALGGVVGGPIGSMIGGNLASMAGSALGLELEGLSPEDREFEASKQFIRFAGQTVANALAASPGGDPHAVAHEAAVEAARTHAPGLMNIAGIAWKEPGRGGTSSEKGEYMHHDIDRTQVGYPHSHGHHPRYAEDSDFTEDEHMNLVSGLMEVNSEEEFENFLGDIVSGVGKFLGSPTGQALTGGLKDVAKKLLPMAGQALGTYVGGPAGGGIGGQLGSALAGSFETGSEELEWEAADTMVRLATEATKKAAEMPAGGNPEAIASKAIIEAAKIHAPQLVGALTSGMPRGHVEAGHCGCRHCRQHSEQFSHQHGEHGGEHHPGHRAGHHSGRWYRNGKHIVLVGI